MPSVAEVQLPLHWCVVMSADCVLALQCTDDLSYIRWQSCCSEVPNKIAATRISQTQIGCCKFVLVAAGFDGLVSIVVPSLVSSTTQIVVFANRGLSQRLSPNPVKFWAALFYPTILNWRKMYEVRSNQHREKTYTWFASGSGFYDAYLVHLVFRRRAKQIFCWFPK